MPAYQNVASFYRVDNGNTLTGSFSFARSNDREEHNALSRDQEGNDGPPPPSDVKAPLGPLPITRPLEPSPPAKGHFKVELRVGRSEKSQQRMLPFHHQTNCNLSKKGNLSVDYYVAIPGEPFKLICKLSHPATKNVTYGARVYVDSTDVDINFLKPFRSWAYPGDIVVGGNENEIGEVDYSVADHYFWFEPGQQEHTIEGFYRSATESEQFVFASPKLKNTKIAKDSARDAKTDESEVNPRKRSAEGDYKNERSSYVPIAAKSGGEVKNNPLSESLKVGNIRIVFCRVQGFRLNRGRNQRIENPQQVAIDPDLEEKIRTSAKPGKKVKDGSSTDREAILSRTILCEKRIIYNQYEGFAARRITAQYCNKVDFYRGMPLECLLKENVRRHGIMAFSRSVPTHRYDLTSKDHMKKIVSEPETVDHTIELSGASTNKWVFVHDIVTYISENLSPAGSYIMCTGFEHTKNNVKNYGEKLLQKQKGVKKECRMRDFADKECGLFSFFHANPHVYEMEMDEKESKRYRNSPFRNKDCYKVKLATICIEDDSDDNEEEE